MGLKIRLTDVTLKVVGIELGVLVGVTRLGMLQQVRQSCVGSGSEHELTMVPREKVAFITAMNVT